MCWLSVVQSISTLQEELLAHSVVLIAKWSTPHHLLKMVNFIAIQNLQAHISPHSLLVRNGLVRRLQDRYTVW